MHTDILSATDLFYGKMFDGNIIIQLKGKLLFGLSLTVIQIKKLVTLEYVSIGL